MLLFLREIQHVLVWHFTGMHWQNSSVLYQISPLKMSLLTYNMVIDITLLTYLFSKITSFQWQCLTQHSASSVVPLTWLVVFITVWPVCECSHMWLRHRNVPQIASQAIQFRRESTHIMCRLYYPSLHCCYCTWLSFQDFQCSWDTLILFEVTQDFKCVVALHSVHQYNWF